jgi:hypothetical protein
MAGVVDGVEDQPQLFRGLQMEAGEKLEVFAAQVRTPLLKETELVGGKCDLFELCAAVS